MSGSKYEEDISMPSKVMAFLKKNRNRESPSNLEPNFNISGLGPSHMTKIGKNVWVHVLMLDAKYEED